MADSLLRQWLKLNDYTQQELAERTGLTLSFINGIINGRNTLIRVDTLVKLSDATGLDAGRLARNLVDIARENKNN